MTRSRPPPCATMRWTVTFSYHPPTPVPRIRPSTKKKIRIYLLLMRYRYKTKLKKLICAFGVSAFFFLPCKFFLPCVFDRQPLHPRWRFTVLPITTRKEPAAFGSRIQRKLVNIFFIHNWAVALLDCAVSLYLIYVVMLEMLSFQIVNSMNILSTR